VGHHFVRPLKKGTEGGGMSGTRKFNDPAETDVKIAILVPRDFDRQLRALAARRGDRVGPIIRGWIIKKLREVESGSSRV
jgi:hypothetical protein